ISGEKNLAIAAGTVFERGKTWMVEGHTYFGMRFLPGVKPLFLDGTFAGYNRHQIDFSLCSDDAFLIEKLNELPDFRSRCDFFLKYYREKLASYDKIFSGTGEIVRAVLSEISDRKGIVRIEQIAEDSGYTSRYIEKVFSDVMGISPKKYASILQFQGAIDFIDKNPSSKISAVATDFGYYDQPAFIRSFKKYTGMTPKSYSEIIKQYNYFNRIVLC
ncbi:MAG: helix-turn-helix domain-containing protein, partial [Candidatus Weimeria sp.]